MQRLIKAKLGNMRKEQEFIVYPKSDKDNIIVQSDKSIGAFNIATGEGVLNTKGSYFPHLNAMLGAKPFTFPQDFVLQCIVQGPEVGDAIDRHGIAYHGTVTEI